MVNQRLSRAGVLAPLVHISSCSLIGDGWSAGGDLWRRLPYRKCRETDPDLNPEDPDAAARGFRGCHHSRDAHLGHRRWCSIWWPRRTVGGWAIGLRGQVWRRFNSMRSAWEYREDPETLDEWLDRQCTISTSADASRLLITPIGADCVYSEEL